MAIDLKIYLNTLRLKGYLAYEYNPFHNYQTDVDLYKIVDKFIVPKGLAVNIKNGEILIKYNNNWIDKRGNIINNDDILLAENGDLFAKEGSLIDLDTDKLNFDLKHPVDIQVLPSYDGSVNLILNDGKNLPRLINSRFSVREKNTYEIVDRIGENDANIYNSKTFERDTSLYLLYEYNPLINYMGFVKGILPVGQYCFYFTYCDVDDNESDYIAETGLIPVFIGSDRDPNSIDGGIKNQQTNKGIYLKITNIDKSYNYLRVYYVRYFADYQLNRVYECKKLYNRYHINSSTMYLLITGNEQVEDLDPNILNITRFNPKSILTSALCKNMLFFGNIIKNTDNYIELSDCALRIIPEVVLNTLIIPDNSYTCNDSKYGYYSSVNMYNNVGYFNEEFYRFGVVFIYLNGTLSNVYNTLGGMLLDTKLKLEGNLFKEKDSTTLIRQYIKIDDNGWVKSDEAYELEGLNINARGVCLFNLPLVEENAILGVKFNISQEVLDYLKNNLEVRGLFFVRQKCINNILALCYLMPMDELLEAPVLEYEDEENSNLEYKTECFVSQSNNNNGGRVVTNDYESRLYTYEHTEDSENVISKTGYAGICPDFLLNQPYYNQIFNGSKFKIKPITEKSKLSKVNRFYKEPDNTSQISTRSLSTVNINTVTEDVPTVAINDRVFRLEIGEAEEAFRFKYAEVDSGSYDSGDEDFDLINKATNIVRGKYSPYLAIYSDSSKLETGILYNIYLDSSISIVLEYQNRMDSSEPFYAISNRYNFGDLSTDDEYHNLLCYRGDCFINNFTYRFNRNFNDPSLPNNDVIIDKYTWRDNYDVSDSSKWSNISRSDLNAVLMGSWITIKVRSAMNYALRSQDHSFVSEEALMGSPRSYYPRSKLMWRGENKMPDSYLYNDAYRASLGFKCYFTLNNINYIKNSFSNRILYSAISIQDSFKNNYRFSLSTYFRDYSLEYGSIQKLVGFEGYILVIFEHAIGMAVINERVLAGNGDGEPVFINTSNVLPEELTIITDTYGTQWPESVIKSEAGFVYGVDTIAKKLWRVKEREIEILSDFKVNKFLIDNISLGERELYPIIGLKNVKTHYNNNKKDIIFTFYDDIYKDEEKVWSLCYNELLDQFITFYSWIPSYSENIDTKFFTFNRNTTKQLALLSKCNYSIPENTGVLVDNPMLDKNNLFTLYFKNPNSYGLKTILNSDGTTRLLNVTPETEENGFMDNVKFVFEHDHWKNYLQIKKLGGNKFEVISSERFIELYNNFKNSGKENTKLKSVLLNNKTCYENYIKDPSDANKESLINSITEVEKEYSYKYDLWNEIYSVYGKTELKNVFKYSLPDDISPYYYSLYGELLLIKEEDYGCLNPKYYEWINKTDKWTPLLLEFALKGGVLLLEVTPYLSTTDDIIGVDSQTTFPTETIAVTVDSILTNKLLTQEDKLISGLTTDFYLHGQAGIFNVAEDLYPTYWYGEFHPFEFEFVVNDNIGKLKIFNNLIIISNKAEPESFHFEIEGDNYEFSEDKRTMYFRLEATKNLYLNLGSDILYNRKFTDVIATKYTLEQHYRSSNSTYTNQYQKIDKVYPVYLTGLVKQVKSTIFPLYYERIDTYNEVYHKYTEMTGSGYDFKNLSGSEIVWNRDLNLFNIVTHIKNNPIDLVGRLRGNSRYLEGRWNIQIPSITFMLKNESNWVEISKDLKEDSPLKNGNIQIPPIVVNSSNLPANLPNTDISESKLPNIYQNGYNWDRGLDVNNWTYRKETNMRDKWIKIRVRYSGKNLAIIHSIITLYNLSYS